jgi:hypothetical protein
LADKTAQLAVAVPQVMAHRMTRMALAGPRLSSRDRKEFELMVAEKNAALGEAWTAMAAQTAKVNQALAESFFSSLLLAAQGRKSSATAPALQWQQAMLSVLGKGLAPVHRKAMANARRLARTKLR